MYDVIFFMTAQNMNGKKTQIIESEVRYGKHYVPLKAKNGFQTH